MKLRYALAGTLAAAVLAIPSLGGAQQTSTREPGWEFGADAIYQFSKGVDFEGGSRLNLHDDFGVGLLFGYRFNPRWELQFALDWSSVNYDGTLQSQSFPGLSAGIHGDMETFVPRINGVCNFMDGPITPYITGGVGWAWVDTNIPTGQVSVGCWWDPWYGQVCTPYQATKSVDSFTYQVGLGVRWDIGHYSTVRLSYDKSWFDFSKATTTPGLDQIKLGFAYRY